MDTFLEWVATAQGWGTPIRWLLASIAREWLHKRTGVVMAPGLKFYPDRETLEKRRDYGKFLGTAQEIYCIYVTGRKLVAHEIQNVQHIKEVILPDPRSGSFRDFAESIQDLPNHVRYVCKATKHIKETLNKDVFWCPEMLHHSMKIGDPDKSIGWVHLEDVLPGTAANKRPSMTIFASKYEDVVRHYWGVYRSVRDKSKEPDMDFVNAQLSGD